jgi:hypothetical protein
MPCPCILPKKLHFLPIFPLRQDGACFFGGSYFNRASRGGGLAPASFFHAGSTIYLHYRNRDRRGIVLSPNDLVEAEETPNEI